MVARAFGQFALLSFGNAARTLVGRVMRPPRLLRRADLGPRRAKIHARVLLSLLVHLPEMLAKRHRIRSRRTVADAEIAAWFYPLERWRARH
jgi:hypothetical protein